MTSATKQRIQGVRPVGNKIPSELRLILNDMRSAILQLNGDSSLGAVRYAEFLTQLRNAIGQEGQQAGGGSSAPPLNLDPYFQDLSRQTLQALADLDRMFAFTRQSEVMVNENVRYTEEVEADVIAQAAEMADQAAELAAQALDLLDLATDIEAIQNAIDDPSTGLLAQSTLLDATVSRVSANEGSIDVITAQITSLQSEVVDATSLDPAIIWQFEGDDDGWTSNATLTTNNAYVTIGAAASTHFTSPSGIVIDGALYPRVVARIRRVSGTGWLGRVTYVTTGTGAHGFDPSNYYLTLAEEPIFAGGGWVIVTWDMELLTVGGNDWVTHVIDQLRLEISNDGATVFEVDWVAIGRVAPSYVTATVAALESRVTATESAIDALSSSVTSLETSVDDLEGGVSSNTGAISALSARVTVTEGDISTISSDITSLDSRLDAAESGISSAATAISGLTSSVSSLEGEISAHASQLTSLDSRLDSLEPAVSGQASAISALQADVTTIGGTLSTHASQLTSLDSRLDSAESGLSGATSAISALDTRLDGAEGQLDSHALSLTSLDARLDIAEGTLSGQATAITNLSARVTTAEGGIDSTAAAVTMLQVYGRDSNKLNPLTIPGNATDWDFGNANVVAINIGGRNTAAGRIRTNTNIQRVSKWLEIDPRGIYEVRMSMLKNLAHGFLYAGLHTSSDGSTNTTSAVPIINRAVAGGASNNPYWTYLGVQSANHSLFSANQWYDFVFYILGSEADASLCPRARVNDVEITSGGWPYYADGFRLSANQRFVLLRVLNYYNSTQTDAYFNNFSISRLDNQRTAALTEEASIRLNADGLLNAQWTLKLDANGYVAGFGLAVTGGASGGVSSSFNVLADRFNIALPGISGAKAVFTVGNINGVPTIGISGNLVVDGTVVTRHLIANAVTNVLVYRRSYGPDTFPSATVTVVATRNIPAATGAPVLVVAQMGYAAGVNNIFASYPSSWAVEGYLYRNGTLLRRQSISGDGPPSTIFYIDTPPAGSVTYTLSVRSVTGRTMPQVELVLLEQKR